ncbi:class I SAM-dependent methyltransferase [Nordella sp. HKS 07]|uniref:class I SAM-dependent methyltransferase n=1 Tax=Nordella sp. HKS 07 TaxID=2712222 RepID=UPI001FEEE942|nr:class I SAM-dependent methyltransferase [Nordella sp. HKS 07]
MSRAPVVAAMEGSGFYNRNSSLQAAGIAAVLPLWEAAIQSADPGGGDLVIADYGSSQGRNSMLPIRMAIDALRAKVGNNIPVQVIHTDLPSNDFASLFKALEEDADSYMARNSHIFPSAIGRSYFDPIIPAGRVTLGWNSWTLQWMSRTIEAPDHVFARFSNSPAVVDAVAKQQADDWQRFLRARAFELRPGGKLLSLFVADDPGHRSWRWIGGEFWGAIADMGDSGLLSERERLSLTFPTNARSLEEIEAPFLNDGQFAGLRIERLELMKGSDPFWGDFEATGDANKLGQSWADTMKAVFKPTALRAISPDRNGEELVEELFSRFASRVAASHQEHEHYLAAVVLAKSS